MAAARDSFTRRSQRRAIMLAMGLVIALLTSALLAGPVTATTPPKGFGVGAADLFVLDSPSYWQRNLDEMQASGIRTVRVPAPWDIVEPTAPDAIGHHYNFSYTDSIARSLAMHGLHWLPTVDYSAPWAASYVVDGRPNLYSPPKNFDDYAAYVSALVRRYGRGGSFWTENPQLTADPTTAIEIWNEPDNPQFWLPQPDPAAYAHLYEVARQAAHAVDPAVQALIGGIAAWPANYLMSLYDTLGGAGQIDALGVHLYEEQSWQVTGALSVARAVLDANGDVNVPIDVTEFGWTTAGPSAVTDAVRAQRLQEAVTWIATSDCNVERITPHTWTTPEADPNNPEDWFGITSPDGTLHESATALASAYTSLAALPAPTHATNPVCGRQLTVSLTNSAASLRSRRARPRHGTSARAHRKAAALRRGRHKHRHHKKATPRPTGRVPAGTLKPAAPGVIVSSPPLIGQPSRSACAQAVVRSGGNAVAGTVVSFAAIADERSLPAPPPATTGANGVATACFSIPTGKPAVISATARDQNFVPVPTAQLTI